MSSKEFQDDCGGDHLGYWNGTILAILSHCDASRQVLVQSDLSLGRRRRLKNFKMAAMATILISERNDFSNSESLCYFQLNQTYGLGEKICPMKNFKIAAWTSERNDFSNSKSPCCHNAPSFRSIQHGSG